MVLHQMVIVAVFSIHILCKNQNKKKNLYEKTIPYFFFVNVIVIVINLKWNIEIPSNFDNAHEGERQVRGRENKDLGMKLFA